MSKIHESLGQHILVDNEAIVVDLKKSQGSWLVDAVTGKKYLDCFSQFASQPLGWNHPKVLAQKDRLLDAAIHKVANSDMYCQDYADFVERFASITPDFPHHFYISGGALAVENALKAAFDWKAQKLDMDDPDSIYVNTLDVIHLREAFHGRSGYTLSLTNSPYSNLKVKWFPKFRWTRVANPKISYPMDKNSMRTLETISLEEIENALKDGHVAAILLEPIQGEGGDNHFRAEYFHALRKLADDYEAMLIFDEVQTGMGLTGKMWAYEHFGIVPDMLCFGKKTQVCGFASTERIDDIPTNVFTVGSRINSTWGGNIVDMVRSTIFMEIIEEDNLVNNAAEVGEYFLDLVTVLNLSNARGRGLMVSFDLSSSDERDRVLGKLTKTILALPAGERSIRFRPHLTFTKEEVDIVIDAIREAIT